MYNVFVDFLSPEGYFMKRIIALVLSLLLMMLSFSGCGKDKKETKAKPKKSTSSVTSSAEEPVNNNAINPLTGVQDLDPAYKDRRPVAVMVNNLSTAHPVQTGLNKADIVYETEVEGGVTRLMAVFKNAEAVDRLGPVRSARYPYIDLALGHDAVYFHCGQDPNYAAPHLGDINDISVETDYYAERISNGLAWEHTLYTYGNLLWQGVNDKGFNTTTSITDPWQNFAGEKEKISFDGTVANTVTVPFDTPDVFTYDPSTGKYIRSTLGTTRTDYVTGETTQVKNLFILNTTIVTYPDGVHRQVYLDGGSGWYVVNGTYTAITWRKGGMNEEMKFFDAEGCPIKVNQGNSWVCIINQSTTAPIFQ